MPPMNESTECINGCEAARLHAFTLRLAQRLFLAAEVLSIKAEKKGKKMSQIIGDYDYKDYRSLATALERNAPADLAMCNLMTDAATLLRKQGDRLAKLDAALPEMKTMCAEYRRLKRQEEIEKILDLDSVE
jgi:hypothetical protein